VKLGRTTMEARRAGVRLDVALWPAETVRCCRFLECCNRVVTLLGRVLSVLFDFRDVRVHCT